MGYGSGGSGGSSLPDITDNAGVLITNAVQTKVPAGSSSVPGIQVGTVATSGVYGDDINAVGLTGGGTQLIVGNTAFGGTGGIAVKTGGFTVLELFYSGHVGLVQGANRSITWSNANTDLNTLDSGLNRVAAGVVSVTDGTTSAAGWLQAAGASRVAANVTNATATKAAITGLSATLKAGRKYAGEVMLIAKNSTAGEGLQFDFSGGSATFTNIEFMFQATPPGVTLGTTVSTTASTSITATTATTTDVVYSIYFTCVCNAAGTLIPQFAEVSHTSGTATVVLGSSMLLNDIA